MATRRYATVRNISDAEILRLYVEEGLDSETIAMRAGCSAGAVLKAVRDQGGTVRRRSGLPADYRRLVSDEDVIRRYKAGESGQELAAEAGCATGTIYAILSKAGVERRPAYRSFRGIVRKL